MHSLGNYLVQQTTSLLENKKRVYLFVVLFTVLPLTNWLAVALIALITLRKGEKEGFYVLITGMSVFFLLTLVRTSLSDSLLMFSFQSIFFNTLVSFIPGYIAASVLRNTRDWRYTLGALFFQTLFIVLLLQLLTPDLMHRQIQHLMPILTSEYPEPFTLLKDVQSMEVNQSIFAHILFGVIAAAFVISNAIILIVARYMQAKCYNPGGLKKEVLAFRSGKAALLLFLGLLICAHHQVSLAMLLLPLMLLYFMVTGFILGYVLFAQKKIPGTMLLMVLTLWLKPIILFPVYVIFGSLDSLFNFRVYLLAKTKESV